MLDGGGTGQIAGTTNWTSQDVRQMWNLLANQETTTHWQHVSGWRKTSELSLLHLSRLKQYRENLIEAWPPEKNEASKAYVARLDYLIETVQGVYDTAAANQQTLSGVTQAIWESRRNLEEIHRQYLAKEKAKQQYDAALAANNGKPPAGQQPTTQSDLEDLNWRARHIMYGLSSELATAQLQLRKPPVYKSSRRVGENPPDNGGSSAMGGSSPPVLPPVVPIPAGGGASYTPPPTPTPAVHAVVPTTPAPGAGPILGGTGPIAPPAVPPTPPSVIPPPPPTVGPGLPPPPITPGLPPGAKPPGLPPGYPTTSSIPVNNGLNKAGFGPNAGLPPRAMPPGGMIGGSPGAGLGQPTSGTAGARRINPVGGVIGGSGATSTGSAGPRPGWVQNRSIGSGQSKDQADRHWDPDNPWETDEGVAPVMMPSRENRRIDPGPTIGSSR